MTITRASQLLLELELPEGVRVAKKGEAVVLSLHRAALQVTVTVLVSVHEWSVEASDRASGASVEDWRAYKGDVATQAGQLDREMAQDVETFVGRLFRSELRMGGRGQSKVALEWKSGEVWEQAVPLGAMSGRKDV